MMGERRAAQGAFRERIDHEVEAQTESGRLARVAIEGTERARVSAFGRMARPVGEQHRSGRAARRHRLIDAFGAKRIGDPGRIADEKDAAARAALTPRRNHAARYGLERLPGIEHRARPRTRAQPMCEQAAQITTATAHGAFTDQQADVRAPLVERKNPAIAGRNAAIEVQAEYIVERPAGIGITA